jgi:hypothetical protein
MHRLIEMRRLIEGYRYHPKPDTRLRLQSFINKNPVAVHLASVEDTEFLRNHNFQINQAA